MISGAIYIVVGLFFFAIPVIGWILGLILIFTGIIKMITGFASAVTPDAPDTVTERIIIKEHAPKEEVNSQDSMADELEKLSSLFEKGHITQEEFDAGKKRILKPYSRN